MYIPAPFRVEDQKVIATFMRRFDFVAVDEPASGLVIPISRF
jgi:predicted FMN-binding regulatory protein PaiB